MTDAPSSVWNLLLLSSLFILNTRPLAQRCVLPGRASHWTTSDELAWASFLWKSRRQVLRSQVCLSLDLRSSAYSKVLTIGMESGKERLCTGGIVGIVLGTISSSDPILYPSTSPSSYYSSHPLSICKPSFSVPAHLQSALHPHSISQRYSSSVPLGIIFLLLLITLAYVFRKRLRAFINSSSPDPGRIEAQGGTSGRKDCQTNRNRRRRRCGPARRGDLGTPHSRSRASSVSGLSPGTATERTGEGNRGETMVILCLEMIRTGAA